MKMRTSPALLLGLSVFAAGVVIGYVADRCLDSGFFDGGRTSKLYRDMTKHAIRFYRGAPDRTTSAVARANANAVAENLAREALGPRSKTVVVYAAFGFSARRGKLLLTAEAIGPAPVRTHGVLFFVDRHGRSVQYLFRLESSDDPRALSTGFVQEACRAGAEEIAGLGVEAHDGTLHVRDVEFFKAHPDRGGEVPVPDGEIAVGLRNPDGSYTNFVPLQRCKGPEQEPHAP